MSIVGKIAILLVSTALLWYLTRHSLRGIKHHGVYRLLAWLATIGLVLVNLEKWFVDALSPTQILSWLLLLLSIVAVMSGVLSLRIGHPGSGRADDSLIGIEKTTKLVDAGIYRYVRHPMYSSFAFAAFGVMLKGVSLLSIVLTAVILCSTVLAAKTEEKENIRYFGDAYLGYMKRTKMFIPFVL